MSTSYLTVRDMDDKGSKDGHFYINRHDAATGEAVGNEFNSVSHNGWGQHSYHQKRQARRAAKALALKLGIDYRQDKEYVNFDPTEQVVRDSVTTTSPLV